MKGMELSRHFYEEAGRPALTAAVPQAAGRWAAGLSGEGSECLGFDDDLSRDHDWGPGFCVWLSDEDYAVFGEALQAAYDSLPDRWGGFTRLSTPMAGKRVGVFSIHEFYSRFLGPYWQPVRNEEWLALPETYLAAATSGQVFEDPLGLFSAVRRHLLSFYPEDVRRKKIAARLAVMAQSGQYNYVRCLRRGEIVAASLALNEFIKAAISCFYLLKRQYMPFYKWSWHGLGQLPGCEEAAQSLRQLVLSPDEVKIEGIAALIVKALKAQGLSQSGDLFLHTQALTVQESIEDESIRRRHILEG